MSRLADYQWAFLNFCLWLQSGRTGQREEKAGLSVLADTLMSVIKDISLTPPSWEEVHSCCECQPVRPPCQQQEHSKIKTTDQRSTLANSLVQSEACVTCESLWGGRRHGCVFVYMCALLRISPILSSPI